MISGKEYLLRVVRVGTTRKRKLDFGLVTDVSSIH